MARFRLRYEGRELELEDGAYLVGRSSSCDVSFGDGTVSRRHAVIHITPWGARIEDMGSRNGVMLNGERVNKSAALHHTDRIVIGAHDLVFWEGRGSVPPERVGSSRKASAPSRPNSFVDDDGDEATRDVDAMMLVSTIVEKYLAADRMDEAVRVLEPILERIEERVSSGTRVSSGRLETARRWALEMGERTGDEMWLDWLFRTQASLAELPSAEEIERLHQVARKIRYSNGKLLGRLIEVLQRKESPLTPPERFLLKRLEALQRVVTAA